VVEEAAEAGADKRQRAMLVVLNPEQGMPPGPRSRRLKALAAAARDVLEV
jgi:hypothetical protein